MMRFLLPAALAVALMSGSAEAEDKPKVEYGVPYMA
jgi:hypothetical protein